MEETRIERIAVCMKTFSDVDRLVLPIVGKCLDGMTKAAESIEPKAVSKQNECLWPCTHAIWDLLFTEMSVTTHMTEYASLGQHVCCMVGHHFTPGMGLKT